MRIFIDCSFVDFSRQPTGIPRVVLKYIEAGYAWGGINGIDVVPVVTTKTGLFPVRPLPGKNPPPPTVKYVKRSIDDEIDGAAAATLLKDAESALRAALIKAGALSSIKGIELEVLTLFAKMLSSGKESLEIDVAPGDIVLFPAYWHDLETDLLAALKNAGAKLFVLVHDMLPISFKKFYKTPWREQFADNLLGACSIANGMLAVSHYTANCVLAFAKENGVCLQHIEVFHNAFDPLINDQAVMRAIENGSYRLPFVSRNKHELLRNDQPYLMVGTIEPKKGHIPVIQSFERLWRNGFDRKLVLVGRRGWMDEEVVLAIKKSPFAEDKLVWFDDLNDVDLYFAYKYSRALIFASYAEGFGIPLIEAAKLELPAICYDTEVAREVAGESALYYSNFDEFEAHIATMEDGEEYRLRKQALIDFSWPNWQETGNRMFDHLASSSGR